MARLDAVGQSVMFLAWLLIVYVFGKWQDVLRNMAL